MKNFIESVHARRSVYMLENRIPISDIELEELIKQTAKDIPSSYNMQSQRIIILFNESHHDLWNIVLNTLRPIVAEDKFKNTQLKINGFDHAYGTILFFEDTSVVNEVSNKFPLFKEQFATWSVQANGMMQYAIWAALASVNIGASLQHYNPLIDDEVKKKWDIPKEWSLFAQMPFGEITSFPPEKDKIEINKKVIIVK